MILWIKIIKFFKTFHVHRLFEDILFKSVWYLIIIILSRHIFLQRIDELLNQSTCVSFKLILIICCSFTKLRRIIFIWKLIVLWRWFAGIANSSLSLFIIVYRFYISHLFIILKSRQVVFRIIINKTIERRNFFSFFSHKL